MMNDVMGEIQISLFANLSKKIQNHSIGTIFYLMFLLSA
jgi:hypothetical protein